jgi:hypothetical protein
MVPRKAEIQDTSDYKNLGKHHWKEYTSTGGTYDPGKANLKPRVEFMNPGGCEKVFFDHDKQTKTVVVYDSEYVFEHYYQKLVVSMGWTEAGVLEEDNLQRFFEQFIAYSKSVGERERLAKIKQRAIEMAVDFPAKTASEWEVFLLEQSIPKKEDTPPIDDVPPAEKKSTKSTKTTKE